MNRIYLDNAATTAVEPEVLEAMMPFYKENFGNPMSAHSFGNLASVSLDEARKTAADFFGCSPEEIIFTSGATEANNLAIKGAVKKFRIKTDGKTIPHIITSAFEHPCVLNSCRALEADGLAEVTYLNVGREGMVEPKKVIAAIKESTMLVSIMHVNNEIGTLQPIETIGRLIKEANSGRKSKIIFHTDATQSIYYYESNAEKLGIDMLSMSAHKIYGPKGVGLLYIKKGTPVARIMDGGSQEFKLRSGTHNMAGIAGLAKALELAQENKKGDGGKMVKLRDHMIARILKEIPDTDLNGSKGLRSPANVNISFRGVEGESLLMYLDMAGIACSTGSACSSENLAPSHVLMAIGLEPEIAHSSIRFSLSRHTTREEIDITVDLLKESVNKLRKISGGVLDEFYKKC